jgi:hypothetical protein
MRTVTVTLSAEVESGGEFQGVDDHAVIRTLLLDASVGSDADFNWFYQNMVDLAFERFEEYTAHTAHIDALADQGGAPRREATDDDLPF